MVPYQSKEIEAYVDSLSDLQKNLLLPMRDAVLETSEKVKEGMKWGSICFFNNKNICGYRVAKQHVTLLFMEGASLKDSHHVLEGTGAKARTYKYNGKEELNKDAIKDLVKQALDLGM